MRDLEEDRTKDDQNFVLPQGLQGGEVSWFTANADEGFGRVVVSRADLLLARNFSCGVDMVLCGAYLNVASLELTPGSYGYLGAVEPDICMASYPNSCSGQSYGPGGSGYSCYWSSGNTSIARISGSTTSASAYFEGVAVGGTSGTGVISSSYCSFGSTGPVKVRAVPTGFHQTSGVATLGGDLSFSYAWSSSSGKLADLSGCSVSETVKYPGTSATYVWPSPPWNTETPNPTVVSIGATYGEDTDDNQTGDFMKPYKAANFTAVQTFSYSCDSGALTGTLYGPLQIVRSVAQNSSGQWVYTGTKSGVAGTYILP